MGNFGGFMNLSCNISGEGPSLETISRQAFVRGGLIVFAAFLMAFVSRAQEPSAIAPAGELSVARIYSQPSLSGQLARGLKWSPDGKLLTYFERRGSGKDAQTELWAMDAAS